MNHPQSQFLVTREECIALLFSPDARPCPRTWEGWKARGIIPYVKAGRLCYYNVDQVRAALMRRLVNRFPRPL
jgi:hypothetical protein